MDDNGTDDDDGNADFGCEADFAEEEAEPEDFTELDWVE